MSTPIQLSPEEQQAIQMLQMTQPEAFQRIVKNGTVNINEVLEWYQRFILKLEIAKARRKQDYIDIEVKPIEIKEEKK